MSAPYTVSRVLGDERLVHGFFGREGGRSMGELASNNMSISVGDNPDLVVSNRSSAAYALGQHGVNDLVVLRQVHSSDLVTITERPAAPFEADAMVTNRADLLLGILTADCAPVLLADPEAGIVAAAHAGWKGTVGGILQKTIDAMVSLGATAKNIHAVIGPTICGAHYEIGPELAADIVSRNERAAVFVHVPEGKTREHFDIPSFLQEQLFEAGANLVSNLNICTYANPDKYFSHRYATHHGTTTGRQISIIGLAPSA